MSAEEIVAPPAVAEKVFDLEEAIGIRPTVKRLAHNLWRITVENERVVVRIEYRKDARRPLNSTLTVDGKPHELVESIDQLALFFRDPEAAVATAAAEIDIPEGVDYREAPPLIQHVFSRMNARAGQFGVQVRLQRIGNRWRLGGYRAQGYVELDYGRVSKRWKALRESIRVVLDGEDISADVDSLEEAFARLANHVSKPSSEKSIGNARGVVGKSNSVQVRNTTVIRN